MDFIFRAAEEFLRKHKRLNRYRRVFAILAAVVVFATTYELILPAITMDRKRAAAMPGVEAGVAENTVWETIPADDSWAEDPAAAADGSWTEDGNWANDGAWTDDGTWTAQDTASAAGTDTTADGQAANSQAADGAVTENMTTDTGSFDTDSSGADTFNTDGTAGSAAGADTFGGSDASGDTWNPENSDSQTDAAATDSSENNSAEGLDNRNSENGVLNPETSDSDQTASKENGTDPFADITDDGTVVDGNENTGNEDTAAADADSVNGASEAADHGAGMAADGTNNASSDKTTAASATDAASATGKTGSNGEALADAAVAGTAANAEQAIEYPVTLTYKGEDYTVTATFDETAELPANVSLDALEILPDKVYKDADGNVLYDDYEVYLEKTVETLEKEKDYEKDRVSSARFFDINFIDTEGYYIEPSAPVTIAVKYDEAPSKEDTVSTVAVHFDEEKNRSEIVETKEEVKKDFIQEVSFDGEKFSVYAIVVTDTAGNVTTTTGETVTLTGTSSNKSHSWSSNNSCVSVESYNNNVCTIKANGTGSVTITHTYHKSSETFKVTVSDTASASTMTLGSTTESIEVGSTKDVTVTTTGVETVSVSSADTSIATASYADGVITISALAEGSTTITVSGTAADGYTTPEEKTITVEVTAAGNLTDEESTAAQGDSAVDGLTVTVKDTGHLKKLSDYHVVVEDAADDYTDSDVLKAYHIYLADAAGDEVSSYVLKNNGKNLNLQVTLTYSEEQEWFSQTKDIKHYKNSEVQEIKNINIGSDNKTISFIVHGFSDFVVVSDPITGGTSTPNGEALDLSDYLTTSAANDWQTIDYPYQGNAQSNKKHISQTDDDADVYIQKNVVPTDVEDEFYVYLSMDKQMSLGELFEGARFALSTNNNRPYGSVYDSLQGSPTLVYDEYNASNAYISYETIINVYDRVTYSGKTQRLGNLLYSYTTTKYGVTPNCSNGSVYVEIPYNGSRQVGADKYPSPDGYGWLTLASGVSLGVEHDDHNGDYLVFNIGLDGNSVLQKFSEVYTVLNRVTDTLGDQVEFGGVVTCDGSYSFENGVLTWNPVENLYAKETQTVSSDSHNWYTNIAQLVYRVRLKTNEADFVSGTEYAVNDSATLVYQTARTVTTTDDGNTYTFSNTTDYDGEFNVPTVQGQLYYILLEKTDEDSGEKLDGAAFAMTGTTGVGNNVTSLSGTRTLTGTTDSDGKLLLGPVPWGIYVLTETSAPDGYKISYSEETLYIGRTGDSTESGITWAADTFTYNGTSYRGVDRTGSNSITNIPIVVKLNLSKKGSNGTTITNAPFTVTAVSSDGSSGGSPLSITLGTYTLVLENGYTYTLTEGTPPDGYQAADPITVSYS